MSVRVVHDGAWTYPGGAERVAREIANAFDCPITLGSMQDSSFWNGHDVDVLVDRPFRAVPDAVKDLYVGMKFRQAEFDEEIIISSGTTAKWWIPKTHQTHLHYCHSPSPGLYIESQDSTLGAAVSTQVAIWDRHYTSFCDAVIANSEFTSDRIERYFDREAEVLHPPIDTGRFYHAAPAETPYFVMIGRLERMKRAEMVARAFDTIEDAELVMIGDGPLREECETYNNVTVYSDIGDFGLRHTVARSVGGIAFAEKEHCGITPKEFQAAGKPVIVPDEPNLQNHVEHRQTGIVVEPSEQGIQRAVHWVLTMNWNHERLQEEAAKWSTDRFHRRIRGLVESVVKSDSPQTSGLRTDHYREEKNQQTEVSRR